VDHGTQLQAAGGSDTSSPPASRAESLKLFSLFVDEKVTQISYAFAVTSSLRTGSR
jgi:hypothetical protein